jgi:hypothetical protein
VPALEVPKPRKLAKVFKLDGSLAIHDTLIMDVVKHLKAAVDRQTEVLSKIYGVLESSAKYTAYLCTTNMFSCMPVFKLDDRDHLAQDPVFIVL